MAAVLAALLSFGGVTVATAGAASASSPPKGGSLILAENVNSYGTWPSLDPATTPEETGEAPFLEAIYGDLFQQGTNGQIVPDLATGYKYLDNGMKFAIYLRHGVTFSDGTPFNSAAVAFSIRRDLDPKNACLCLSTFSSVKSVATQGNYTVILSLSQPDGQLKYSFFTYSPNFTVDPTAFKKMGAKAYSLMPVGAGPFELVSNNVSSKMVLKKNPRYWQKGHPYLSSLTILSVTNDETAYDALLTGEADVYQGYGSITSLDNVAKHVKVTATPAIYGPRMITLNTTEPPFNNLLAREAIYYATDPGPINKALFDSRGVPAESPTIPGGLYYQAKVPGYRSYDPTKAEAIVKQLGGLTVQLLGSQNTAADQVMTALASEWKHAGINASVSTPLTIPAMDQHLQTHNWQASLESAGGFDPALGIGLNFFYSSTAAFSGIHDSKLDQMIADAAKSSSAAVQDKSYKAIWKYISDQAYTPFLFMTPTYNLSSKGASVPGLTTSGFEPIWQDASMASS